MQRFIRLRRSLAGVVGTAILLPSLYFGYIVGRGMYYDYILFPKLKADEHYIAPTRWQDFTFLAVFWAVFLTVAFVAFRMIRFAVKSNLRISPD